MLKDDVNLPHDDMKVLKIKKKNIEKIVYYCIEFHQWYQNNLKKCTCKFIAKPCLPKTKVAHL